MRESFLTIFITFFLLTACSSDTITFEVTRVITQVAFVEVTTEVEVTRLVEQTRVVQYVVTETSTPNPDNGPPISNNSTPTPSPSPTVTPTLVQATNGELSGDLESPKGDGTFTVGVDILPGKWRSTGNGISCYWARLDANQDLIDNHFGYAGGTVNIRITDFQVEFESCGTWEYVEDADQVLQAGATAPKNDGFYTVNVEIAPGRWQSTGTSDSCYWARLDENQVVLENHFGLSGEILLIPDSDYEITFEGCGTWQYLGP